MSCLGNKSVTIPVPLRWRDASQFALFMKRAHPEYSLSHYAPIGGSIHVQASPPISLDAARAISLELERTL